MDLQGNIIKSMLVDWIGIIIYRYWYLWVHAIIVHINYNYEYRRAQGRFIVQKYLNVFENMVSKKIYEPVWFISTAQSEFLSNVYT